MKRFRFKLDPLLRIREHAERQAERDLADVNAELITIDRTIQDLSDEVMQTVSVPTERSSDTGQLDIHGLYARQTYLVRMQQEIDASFRARSAVEQRFETARERFSEAHRETEVLSRLRETRSQRHYAEARRVEAVELDDIVGSRAVRARGEGVTDGSQT